MWKLFLWNGQLAEAVQLDEHLVELLEVPRGAGTFCGDQWKIWKMRGKDMENIWKNGEMGVKTIVYGRKT